MDLATAKAAIIADVNHAPLVYQSQQTGMYHVAYYVVDVASTVGYGTINEANNALANLSSAPVITALQNSSPNQTNNDP